MDANHIVGPHLVKIAFMGAHIVIVIELENA